MDDYLDADLVQLLIDAGVSLGFHGHQHSSDCFDERYRIGMKPRKMTIISASTLCAEPRNLSPGVPRSYNIIELDSGHWAGRVHQRQMTNKRFDLPIWGPGHFIATGEPYCDFEICKPLLERPSRLDAQLLLENADAAVGAGRWGEALQTLDRIRELSLARPLILRALLELADNRQTIDFLWPPQSVAEAVTLGGAVLENGTRAEAAAFAELPLVSDSTDASLRNMLQRIRERRLG